MTDAYFFAFAGTMALLALLGLVVWLVERRLGKWPSSQHPSYFQESTRRVPDDCE